MESGALQIPRIVRGVGGSVAQDALQRLQEGSVVTVAQLRVQGLQALGGVLGVLVDAVHLLVQGAHVPVHDQEDEELHCDERYNITVPKSFRRCPTREGNAGKSNGGNGRSAGGSTVQLDPNTCDVSQGFRKGSGSGHC